MKTTDDMTPEQYARFLAGYRAAMADTRTEQEKAQDHARALRPEAVTLLTALAAEYGLELSYLAGTESFGAHLADPSPYYRSAHGHILSYQSWNERWSGIGGRELAAGEARAYLAVYSAHRDWHPESVFTALRRETGKAGTS